MKEITTSAKKSSNDQIKYCLGSKKSRKKLIKDLMNDFRSRDFGLYAEVKNRPGVKDAFVSAYKKHPFMDDPYLCQLSDRYHLYLGYNEEIKLAHAPIYSENPPTLIKSLSRKSNKKYGKKHGLIKKYKGIQTIDRRPVDWKLLNERYTKPEELGFSFDISEIWNLDDTLPFLLYPRFKYFLDNHIGYNNEYTTMREYDAKVLKPIVRSLKIHFLYVNGMDEYFINKWISSKGGSQEDSFRVDQVIQDEIKEGYKLIAKNLFDLWD